MDKTIKYFFLHPEDPLPVKNKTGNDAVVSARRFLQYWQLPNKNSRNISRDVGESFVAFQNFYLTIPRFSRGTSNDVLQNPGWETLDWAISTEVLLT
jgi:hypothetical protein